MKRTLLLFCLSIYFFSFVQGQGFSSQDPAYISNVKAGEAALNSEKYDSCLLYYKEAFKIKQTSCLSTLRGAACAYKAEDEVTLDNYLTTAFDLNWDEAKSFFMEYPEFKFLEGTSFEKMIESRWAKAAKASGINLALMEEFEEIKRTDQVYRAQMREVSDKYGWQSPQMDSLWKLQSHADSINTAKISEVIDNYGYPGKSLVGPGQASTAFLVIQHAPLEVQEKYYDIIIKAADEGEVSWRSVALLVDRVKMRNGQKQIYGSQVNQDHETGEYYFFEIENPHQIDSIRATVGLGALQQYADNWNFKWNPDEHVKRHSKKK